MKKLSIYLSILLVISTMALMGFIFPSPVDKMPPSITWISMEKAATLAKRDGKKILIDFTIQSCRWCKVMDREAYAKPEIIDYINKNFHAVKFDTEKTKEEININGTTYKHRSDFGRNGIHEWAIELMEGRFSYPLTTFLNSNAELITNFPGYHKPKAMITILNFVGEDAYQDLTWQQYQKAYKKQEELPTKREGK